MEMSWVIPLVSRIPRVELSEINLEGAWRRNEGGSSANLNCLGATVLKEWLDPKQYDLMTWYIGAAYEYLSVDCDTVFHVCFVRLLLN